MKIIFRNDSFLLAWKGVCHEKGWLNQDDFVYYGIGDIFILRLSDCPHTF